MQMDEKESRPRVVIADDDPDIRRLVEMTVTNAGCDVTVASDGEEALERVRESKPDLVILDVLMPRMDGWEVARALKSDPATREVPVMFLTSRGQEHDVLEGFDSGAVDYMVKPFSPRELQVRVRAVLAKRQ
ncbi:MAG: response regulator transcription factor [Candidatus Eremiobacterales bacterium]|jgi:DNA-binding response OmpR family regulator